MQVTGECSERLYAWLLVVRSRLPHDTQDVEGMNSVLQRMCDIAPNMHIPLASDRMRIKMGARISAEEAVELHPAIMDTLRSLKYVQRFASMPAILAAPAPLPIADGERAALAAPAGRRRPAQPPAPYVVPGALAASLYARPMAELMPQFASQAFSLTPPAMGGSRPAFVMVWKYFARVSVAMARVDPLDGGGKVLRLDSPVRIQPLVNVLIGALPPAGAPLTAWSGRLEWLTLQTAELHDEKGVE
eukprot:1565791-Pyramimonas_sp.AAC.1